MTTVPEIFGSSPASYQWVIVRGDTGVVKIEFVEDDEVTPYDTNGWLFSSSVYDEKGNEIVELDTVSGDGYVEITATPDVTEEWGTGFKGTVAELAFDLQVEIDDIVWTPIIGTIKVIADVTGGSL
jgi:hypothetical protein